MPTQIVDSENCAKTMRKIFYGLLDQLFYKHCVNKHFAIWYIAVSHTPHVFMSIVLKRRRDLLLSIRRHVLVILIIRN